MLAAPAVGKGDTREGRGSLQLIIGDKGSFWIPAELSLVSSALNVTFKVTFPKSKEKKEKEMTGVL